MKIYLRLLVLSFSLILLTNFDYVHAIEIPNVGKSVEEGTSDKHGIEEDITSNDITIDDSIEKNRDISDAVDDAEAVVPVHKYFYDLPVDHYAYEAINNLYEINAVNIRQEHKFMPNEWISRAEFLHMLLRAKGFTATDEIIPVFTDVTDDVPFASYVNTAYRIGIVDGLGNNLFRPGDPVKRDALIKMLITGTGLLKYDVEHSIRWDERKSLLSAFQDKNMISAWAEHYISHALKYNLITGYPDNTIRPNQNTTRAEAAVLINRFFLSDATNIMDLSSLEVNGGHLLYTEKKIMEATQYHSSEPGLGNYTRMGLRTRVGAVAVDPSIIPLGTYLYIEGYGYAVAADTGGSIKGEKIDLYAYSLQGALQFGRQNVVVYILP